MKKNRKRACIVHFGKIQMQVALNSAMLSANFYPNNCIEMYLINNIMNKLILIDGNSIMNRAFYGIMGSKMLTTEDGTYTNAVYGFLAILFKIQNYHYFTIHLQIICHMLNIFSTCWFDFFY